MDKMPKNNIAAKETALESEPFPRPQTNSEDKPERKSHGVVGWLKALIPAQPQSNNEELLREAIEEYIEDTPSTESDHITRQERELFSNILKLRDIKVYDVMLPRADIAAIEIETPKEEILQFITENPHSRFPIYKDTLDNVIGSLHIKDILATFAEGVKLNIKDILTDMPIVSPSMPILDLLMVMRKTRRHMVLVVDEYGGIDGMVTMGDVLETIIGEIDDEHALDDNDQILKDQDGAFFADARVSIEKFEELFGKILTGEEREESDTLGGLIFALAGRVPARGEILTHSSGIIFEILDADPRRISRLKIRNAPENPQD